MFHKYVKLLIENSRRISNEKLDISGNVSKLSEGFPKEYRGLEVKVGFGKGNWAQVTWIGFLTKDQTIQKGIYPVYLYYRNIDILILAYGVSEKYESDREWKTISKADTVKNYLEAQRYRVNRYRKSLVYKPYTSEEIRNITDRFDTDLNTLIDYYKDFMSENTAPISESNDSNQVSNLNTHMHLQTIFFGSPGTGKSYGIKKELLEKGIDEEKEINTDRLFRTTFHPDTDYSAFVGCYKPVCEERSSIKQISELHTKAQELMDEISKSPGAKVELLSIFMAEHAESLLKAEAEGKSWKSILEQVFSKGYINNDSYLHSLCKIVAEINIKQTTCISYKFVPQVFTRAYEMAWNLSNSPNKTVAEKQVYLVIEEINRGNCAQIFGDLFQLLDRKSDGYSEYPVKADTDLALYLENKLGENHPGIKGGNLCLPPNLNIIATMNTSDQSLFPMDSAFKRRWEWYYIPTKITSHNSETSTIETKVIIEDKENKKDNVLINHDFKNTTIHFGVHEYKWTDFLREINKRIREATKNDDKLLGYWFVKGDINGNISISTFVSKVIFYLWNDVFKEYGTKGVNPFCITAMDEKNQKYKTIMSFNQFFDENTGEINLGVVHTFMGNIGLIPEINEEIKNNQDESQAKEGAPIYIDNK